MCPGYYMWALHAAAVGHIRKVNVHRAHTFGLHVAFLGVGLNLEKFRLDKIRFQKSKSHHLTILNIFQLGFPKSSVAYVSNFGHLDFRPFRKQKYVCNKSFQECAL